MSRDVRTRAAWRRRVDPTTTPDAWFRLSTGGAFRGVDLSGGGRPWRPQASEPRILSRTALGPPVHARAEDPGQSRADQPARVARMALLALDHHSHAPDPQRLADAGQTQLFSCATRPAPRFSARQAPLARPQPQPLPASPAPAAATRPRQQHTPAANAPGAWRATGDSL